MTAKLTDELRQALSQQPGQPLRVEDPVTQTQYILISADIFERMQHLTYDDSEFDPREAYPLVDRIMADDDANDPTLDSYQHHPDSKQP